MEPVGGTQYINGPPDVSALFMGVASPRDLSFEYVMGTLAGHPLTSFQLILETLT